jgi:hypothetical protein
MVFRIRLAKVRVPMVAMPQTRSTSCLGPEFNAFLFASIDEGVCEARLSVVSALARLDLDPWQEAAELTELPRDTAVQRLAALLSKLREGGPANSDSHTIAQRLIALLPGRIGPASGSSPADVSGADMQVTMIMTLFILMSMIFTAASGLDGRGSPGTSNASPAPAATEPKAPPAELQP